MKRIVLVVLLCLCFLPAWSQMEFVDMGCSVKWATCNVGASSPEQYGKYLTFDEVSATNIGRRRCPTDAEWAELRVNCNWTWTTQNGVDGMRVTSPETGNSIFLPAAGYQNTGSFYSVGEYGNYWSATKRDSSFAKSVIFNSGGVERGNDLRSICESVRRVLEY